MKKAVIVGGGFAGCTAAYMLKQKGFDVVVLEGSELLGGGCRTFFYHGHPYTFGPHHLLVNLTEMHVLHYFEKFLEMRELDHRLLTYVEDDHKFYSYPIHIDDIKSMPDSEKILKELEDCDEDAAKKADNFEDFL